MIKVICLGKIKEKYFIEALNEYKKRLSKYTKIEIIELDDEKDDNPKIALEIEEKSIIKHIKEKDNLVILDIEGKQMDSISFSNFIDKELSYNSNITFLIGSSNGLSEKVKSLSSKKISFSKLTFPHQLFRILLLEQIYRSFRILNNEKYHK